MKILQPIRGKDINSSLRFEKLIWLFMRVVPRLFLRRQRRAYEERYPPAHRFPARLPHILRGCRQSLARSIRTGFPDCGSLHRTDNSIDLLFRYPQDIGIDYGDIWPESECLRFAASRQSGSLRPIVSGRLSMCSSAKSHIGERNIRRLCITLQRRCYSTRAFQ